MGRARWRLRDTVHSLLLMNGSLGATPAASEPPRRDSAGGKVGFALCDDNDSPAEPSRGSRRDSSCTNPRRLSRLSEAGIARRQSIASGITKIISKVSSSKETTDEEDEAWIQSMMPGALLERVE